MADLPKPTKKKTTNWSAIWVLPLIALAIGLWLGWKSMNEAGINITIYFENGEGIQVGKTQLMYKGIQVGKVTDLHVSDDIKGVVATVEVLKEAEPYLSKETRFWLVRPRVSLAGVTGLETLVSGIYIAIDPVKGEPERKYHALAEPPPLSDSLPGLHITLKAERLGSLEQGSPVYYRQIQVGQVKSYQLAADQRTVEIKVLIEQPYAHLVRKHTRFWNASGLNVTAGLSGVKIRTESLLSMAAGGIAFATPENRQDSPPTDSTIPFRLYDGFEAAEAGLKVLLRMEDVSGLNPGNTPVMYNGVQVGTLKKLDMDKNFAGATAELTMEPRTEDFLVEGTEFWTVKPSISLAGISGIEALVKGNYIAVRFAKSGTPTREFTARPKAPPLNTDAPGLHLVLTSDKLGSLDVGSPILYKQMRVGSIQSYQLSRDHQRVVVGVHIEPEFASLVNESTRFWNVSGVSIKGGLSGVEVKSESLQTLLAGGIAFATPDAKATPVTKPRRFTLYDNENLALGKGTLVEILMPQADGLREGTPVRYKGLDVGSVERISLADDLSRVVVVARITESAERIAREGTQFWVVKPELGLVRTANLDTLVSGQYLEVQPSSRKGASQTRFTALAQPPSTIAREEGLRVTLSTARRGSIKPGVVVSYREVPVGKVESFELGSSADRVLIHILIEPRYAPLVRSGTRFWNASGVGIDAGLFKGVKVRTESLEALLEGGIAFATPDNAQMGSPAIPGQTFALHDELNEEWMKWAPKIELGK
ncbi:MlaD family protein [Pseudomonas otitidis]|uniref:PqiB family protein n=1 Tax=Metapseudomonas otitidis TaxID=319939 RepID=UPI00244B1467|nr:MlaD family protein [Pseudomonas otitidis]MDH1105909.1 MlaD family protein [Pseudomonas otitidis]MDH1161358.1 MlaD family protein [Pseudomonas otitidis]MDH1166607.1 MlaD family protein [Pseudomonas otitidis]